MKKINTIIIGLGKIGFGYVKDYMYFRSHSYSILSNKRFRLIGGVDNSKKKRDKFEKKFNLPVYRKIPKDLYKKLDLIVIASNTQSHYQILKKILQNCNSKTILCEKPFTENYHKAQKINVLNKKRKNKIFVNYNRQPLTSLKKLKSIITNDSSFFYGKVIYPNGVINNCSHFLHLFFLLFGNIKKIKILGDIKFFKYRNLRDFNRNFELQFQKCKVYFEATNNNSRSYLIKLYSKSKIITWKSKSKINVFDRKKTLKIDSGMKYFQKYVYNELAKDGKKSTLNLCTAKTATNILSLISMIKNEKI